ncbi:MAG: hypothetical protein EON59_09960 [Alphaproteobacteria bacterium]|nr:MAG: hypothetical protein EON59_09960 [Alphaproteobacteria bacterium]
MSDGRNTWRHYTVRGTGECTGLDDSGEKLVRYDMGIVETGRSRVFTGYFFKVTSGDDEEIIGEDGGSMVRALKRLACEYGLGLFRPTSETDAHNGRDAARRRR